MKSFLHPAAPYTMQAASNIVVPAVELMYSVANPSIYQITTDGAVTVKSIYNGQPKSVEYPNGLSAATLAIEADANTKISIIGGVKNMTLPQPFVSNSSCTELYLYKQDFNMLNVGFSGMGPAFSSPQLHVLFFDNKSTAEKINVHGCAALTSLDLSANTALTSLICSDCSALTSLDLSANTALTSLNCPGCAALTSLDLSANTELTSLDCSDCSALTSLDLSANTALTSLICSDCAALTSLDLSANTVLTSLSCINCNALNTAKYRAINDTPSDSVASAITAATSTTGIVYLNSTDTYYSTVANAATTKGWTIAAL